MDVQDELRQLEERRQAYLLKGMPGFVLLCGMKVP